MPSRPGNTDSCSYLLMCHDALPVLTSTGDEGILTMEVHMAEPNSPPGKGSHEDVRTQWEADKIDFGRHALAHARRFMELDNAIVQSLSTVAAAAAKYAEAHPERVFTPVKETTQGVNPGDIAGGDFGSDLLDLIKEIVVKDKQFFLDLIKSLLGL